MDISSVGGTALTESAQAIYAATCLKMVQHSDNVANYLILDTVEISKEAMEKFMAERNAQ